MNFGANTLAPHFCIRTCPNLRWRKRKCNRMPHSVTSLDLLYISNHFLFSLTFVCCRSERYMMAAAYEGKTVKQFLMDLARARLTEMEKKGPLPKEKGCAHEHFSISFWRTKPTSRASPPLFSSSGPTSRKAFYFRERYWKGNGMDGLAQPTWWDG